MRKRLGPAVLLVLAAALQASVSRGGPNAGGVLVAHDVGTNASCDLLPGDPASCEQVDNELPAGAHPICMAYYWKVYAIFPPGSGPRLKALSMGAAFGADVYVVLGGLPDPANDFEIPDAGWPNASGSGVGVSYGLVKTAEINDCYWFAGYGYSGTWSLAPHPIHGAVFVDDSFPPEVDPVAALGSIGFGQPGVTPCPTVEGACCFPDGSCATLTGTECAASGGDYLGGPCDPNPCATPAGPTTWGRVKQAYR